MRLRLRQLQEVGKPDGQSALHVRIRKEALVKMVETMPPGRPHWTVLSELVYDASGKSFSISPDDLRREFADLSSVASRKSVEF
jgi:hypothetical protein